MPLETKQNLNYCQNWYELTINQFPIIWENSSIINNHWRTWPYHGINCSKTIWSEVLVAHSCPTLCDSMDSSLPHSSLHGISRQEYWSRFAISFTRRSCRLRDWTQVSSNAGRISTMWATWESLLDLYRFEPSLLTNCIFGVCTIHSTNFYFSKSLVLLLSVLKFCKCWNCAEIFSRYYL